MFSYAHICSYTYVLLVHMHIYDHICAYTTCSYVLLAQFPGNHLFHRLFTLLCCIHVLRDYLFDQYHHKTYICNFVASIHFLL